jgi:hypothetical protein
MKNLENVLESNLIEDYNFIALTDLGYDEEGDRLVVKIKTTGNLDTDFNTFETIEKQLEEIGWVMECSEFPEMSFENK